MIDKDRVIIPWFNSSLGDYYSEIDGVIYLSNIKRVREFFDTYKRDCVLVSPCSDFNVSLHAGRYYVHEMTNGAVHCEFKEIPENVKKWFCCNLNITHPRIECLPIGILQTHNDLLDQIKPQKRTELLYINFTPQNHKVRWQIYENRRFFKWATIKWPLQGKSEEEYSPTRIDFFNQLTKHRFCLSPPGNGWDCYRNYEALYLGCIPIVLDSAWSRHFIDLPILRVKSFFDLNVRFLDEQWDRITHDNKKYNFNKLKLSFWQNKIKEEKDKLSEP